MANCAPIIIDGGVLEGGGQILRNALALAGLLRRPLQVVNIRGNRPKPGLAAQHLLGLRLANEITGGVLSGDAIGSTEIRFAPGKAAGASGQFFGDTGTAGSVTLLLQANLPILVFGTRHQCSLRLRGGTNVGMAPQVDFTTGLLRPLLERFGVRFSLDVVRRGYYPKGGGEVAIAVEPRFEPMLPIDLTERGNIVRIDGYSYVGGQLPLKMANEMAQEAERLIKAKIGNVLVDIRVVKEEVVGNYGSGSGIVLIASTSTGTKLAGSALGDRGSQAGQVGLKAAEELIRELESGAAVDSHTQDQLIIFMALAAGRSRILAGPVTLHTQTGIYVVEQMLPQVKFTITPVTATLNVIECDGIGFSAASNMH